MKICLDLRALQIGHENRGIGMYIRSMLEHLPDDPNTTYMLYVFDKNNPVKTLDIKVKFKYTLVKTKTVKTAISRPKDILNFLRLARHSFKTLAYEKPDVFVQFDANLGLPGWRRTKTVVVGYDLIPLILQRQYLPSIRQTWSETAGKRIDVGTVYRYWFKNPNKRREGAGILGLKAVPQTRIMRKLAAAIRAVYYKYRFALCKRVYRRADKLVCISQAAAETFREYLDIDNDRLDVMHLAPVLSSDTADYSVASKIKKPFLFYVGGTDSRKNIQDIIYAFNIVKSRGMDVGVVLAGNEFKSVEKLPNVPARNAIASSPYKDDIYLAGFITDAQKIGLYEKAFAFVFCSSYEGFGLPILEAMASGCPVVSYDNSSIPEISGNAALLVETGNYTHIAKQLLGLKSEEIRKTLTDKGKEQARRYSWDASARQFAKILASLN